MYNLKDSVFFTKLLLLILLIVSLKTFSPKLCLMSYTAFRKLFKFNMFHWYEARLLKCMKSVARRKTMYVREAVNYSIDVCCFVGFSLPISVMAFQLFLQTSAHYFMQFN